jgi:citronellol/citronellal dehydrogenase
MHRAGLPDEVASTIAFLSSRGGGYVTGSTVIVDGGADAWGQGTAPPAIEPPADPVG